MPHPSAVAVHAGRWSGRHHLAGRVDHRDLDAGAEAGIQAHGAPAAGGRGEQQVAQVRGEDAYRLVLRGLAQPHPQIDAQVQQDPGAPGPAHGVRQPTVRGPAAVRDAEAVRDGLLVTARAPVLPVRDRVATLIPDTDHGGWGRDSLTPDTDAAARTEDP